MSSLGQGQGLASGQGPGLAPGQGPGLTSGQGLGHGVSAQTQELGLGLGSPGERIGAIGMMACGQCQPTVLVGVVTCLDLLQHAQKVLDVYCQHHQQHHQQHHHEYRDYQHQHHHHDCQQEVQPPPPHFHHHHYHPQPSQSRQGLLEQALVVILRMWSPSQISRQISSQIPSQISSQMPRQMSYTQELVLLRVLQVFFFFFKFPQKLQENMLLWR